MQKRDPRTTSEKDMGVLVEVRHANINAFWAREPGTTISGNLGQAKNKMEKIGDYFGFDSVSPAMPPFRLEDTFRMKAAICLLRRSLDNGKMEEHVQFTMARKLRSAFSNVYHTWKELA
jgi:hypothetical protein